MFARIAARSLARLLVFLTLAFASPATALAQYQAGLSATAAATSLNPAFETPEPFGGTLVDVTEGDVADKWHQVLADIQTEDEVLAACRNEASTCPEAAQRFLTVIADGSAHTGRARIGLINRAINLAIAPQSDLAQWGVPDRWSAPLTTLRTGRGDCEDYAIAKYVALKEAGVAEVDLRLVIVRDLVLGQNHAVVAARLDGRWIVLDNRRFVLLDDMDMPRVAPLFVLAHDGVKQFTTTPAVVAERRDTAAPGALGLE